MESDYFYKRKALWIAIRITLAILLMVNIVGAIPVEEWNRTYGGEALDEAQSVQQITDGGYIIAGGTGSYGYGRDAWLIKTDENGYEVWNKTLNYWTGYGGVPDSNRASTVQQTSDGGYVIVGAGSTAAGSSSQTYAFIIKTDGYGNKQCDNKFVNPWGTNIANSVRQTTDGGYIIVGSKPVQRMYTRNDIWLLKLHPDCTWQWEQGLGGEPSEDGYSIQQTPDGGFIIAGTVSQTDINALLIKTDADGIVEWQRTFGGIGFDFTCSVQQTFDGGYILGGQTSSYSSRTKAWLIKTYPNGIEEWNKTHGGAYDNEDYTAQQTVDGGYTLAGVTRSSDGRNRKASLIKTDINGNHLWNMTFGGSSDDYVYSFQQTSDDGYILAGRTGSYGAGLSDAWLIKVSADDNNPPTTNIELSGTFGTNNWYVSNVQVTLTATDNVGGSGIAKTEYSLNNGVSWIQYSEQFTISDEGTKTILYKSTDVASNIEEQKTQTVKIDKNPPVITGNAIIPPNGKGWYNTDVTVRFNCEDTISEPIESFFDVLVNTEGKSQSVSGKCIDNAGNEASLVVPDINIDKTIPGVTISSPEPKDYLHTESLTLDFSALDTISGMDSITSSLDATPVINGDEIDLNTLTLGQHTLVVNAIDNAGITATNSVTFNLIGVVPAIVDVKPDTLNKASQGGMVTGYIYIELPGYDVNNIDVSTVKLSTNKGEVSALNSPTEVGDHNGNGIPDLMVKFDRQEVIEIVDIGDVLVTISGKISGEDFEGSDIIHVIEQPEQVPEFPTVALPILSIIGLMFLFQRRQGK